MEFNHSKYNLCMVREIHCNSLTGSCSPLCLYSKLLSINKPDGFDTDMFSVCTFITTRLCNHNLSFPLSPFSCYHHPSYKLLHCSKMPTLTSECHPARTTLKQFKDFSSLSQWLHRHAGGLANIASNRASQNNCWLCPKVKHKTKRQDHSIFGF